jgi:hypothetical protein
LTTLLVVLTAACGRSDLEKPRNVKPPRPGVPARVADVVGIYRTTQGSLLQLRQSGEFLLIVRQGALDGRFDLRDGHLSVHTGKCARDGRYDVRVSGVQQPNKARLEFAAVDDPCEVRRRPLTTERWVYGVS